jgi:hypothetical protein
MDPIAKTQEKLAVAYAARAGLSGPAPGGFIAILMQILMSLLGSSGLCPAPTPTPTPPKTILDHARLRSRRARKAYRWAAAGVDIPEGFNTMAAEEATFDIAAPEISTEQDVVELQAAIAG